MSGINDVITKEYTKKVIRAYDLRRKIRDIFKQIEATDDPDEKCTLQSYADALAVELDSSGLGRSSN